MALKYNGMKSHRHSWTTEVGKKTYMRKISDKKSFSVRMYISSIHVYMYVCVCQCLCACVHVCVHKREGANCAQLLKIPWNINYKKMCIKLQMPLNEQRV